MKTKNNPMVVVRRVSKNWFEYYFEQEGKRVNFYVDQKTHEDLKKAQALADQQHVPAQDQNAEPAVAPIMLQIVGEK